MTGLITTRRFFNITAFSITAAVGATVASFETWRKFMPSGADGHANSAPEPEPLDFSITNPTKPNPTTLIEAPHIRIDRDEIEKDFTKQAQAAFKKLLDLNLLPDLEFISAKTGIDIALLAAIAWRESNLDPTASAAKNLQPAKGKVTAYGIMQITDGDFLYKAQRYVPLFAQEIAERGGRAGLELLSNQQFLGSRDPDANRQKYTGFRLEQLENRIKTALKSIHLPAKAKDAAKAKVKATDEAMKWLEERYLPDLDKQVGQARTPFISLLFSAKDLQHAAENLPKNLSASTLKKLDGTEARFAHMFGIRGRLMLLTAYQDTPGATLGSIFTPKIIHDNSSSSMKAEMRVDDYVEKCSLEFGTLYKHLQQHYQNWRANAPSVAQKQDSNPQPKTPASVAMNEKRPETPAARTTPTVAVNTASSEPEPEKPATRREILQYFAARKG